jgi:hypothetical protein
MVTDPESSSEAEPAKDSPPRGVLDPAPSGRSKCRACAQTILKGAWRVGEIAANPFAEGETTYWFHARCAAERRAAVWQHAMDTASQAGTHVPAEVLADLALATRGIAFPRLTRLTQLEHAPSGRARCRQCREAIEKGALRVALSQFHSGRFDPLGFAHLSCVHDYVGCRVTSQDLARLTAPLNDELQSEVQTLLDESGTFPS